MRASNVLWKTLLRRYEKELMLLFAGTIITPQNLRLLHASEWFQTYAEQIAYRMVQGALRGNIKSWREAAFKKTNSRKVYEALKHELENTSVGDAVARAVRENALLIKSLPLTIAESITSFAQTQYAKGGRTPAIEREIKRKAPHLAKYRVKCIARTEVSKVETELTRARSLDIGVEWYVWTTAEDQRTRKSHARMNGVIVNWRDSPSPEILVGESSVGHYHAGCIWNCRCISLPLIDTDEVSWPAPVYQNGRISRVSLTAFRKKLI